jgi:peroxiredoxin Q/BCP
MMAPNPSAPTRPPPLQDFGVHNDLLGLIPGRQTYVFDKAGSCVLSFNSQLNTAQHVVEAVKAIKGLQE